ncbi:MAG: alpha-galactosidase [Firmicutes bacterium]|nr:alpha-galactosidase [Bacillota bacterium]
MQLNWKITTDKEDLKGEALFQEISEGRAHFRLNQDLKESALRSVTAEITVDRRLHTRIFMNGYQTWTTCPEYGVTDRERNLRGLPRAIIDRYSLDRYGDSYFDEFPRPAGIFHGFSWCWFRDGEQFKLFGSLEEENGYTIFTYDVEQSILTISKDSAGLKVGGMTDLMDIGYYEGTQDEVFDRWFEDLGIRKPDVPKLYGYSSWYNRYQNIHENEILEDLRGCKDIFSKGDLFQIDDGWEPFVGDWLECDRNKFPSGMRTMAETIHDAGFRAGLWLAPFAAEEKSSLYREHPDWFFKVNGGFWKLGCNWSGFYSLDIDHPEVRDYLTKVFDRVFNEWGFDFVKLDFLYGAAPFGSDTETRAGRMIRALKFLKTLTGDKTVLSCGVPMMPVFGLFDYARIGCDVTLDLDGRPHMQLVHMERPSTLNAVQNMLSRYPLDQRAFGSDPDVFFLRSYNIQLNEDQRLSLATLDALLGSVFLTSDDPARYTDEMKEMYRKLRHLSTATNVRLKVDEKIRISYDLDGETHTAVVDPKLS